MTNYQFSSRKSLPQEESFLLWGLIRGPLASGAREHHPASQSYGEPQPGSRTGSSGSQDFRSSLPVRGGVHTRTGRSFFQAMKTFTPFSLALAIWAVFSLSALAQPSLGTTAALEGPGAGVDSVVLGMPAPTNAWTATANDAWLHLNAGNQRGTGSTN